MSRSPRVTFRSQVESGSVTVEAVILTPVVMLFVLLAIAFGRYESTSAEVSAAARAGVEAASIASSPSQASLDAREAALPAITGGACADVSVKTDASDFQPGGQVQVTVTCSVKLSDIGAPGLPGTSTLTDTQTAPIDLYREVP
jgi:Flp pilus assembly protein TadG